MKLLLLLAIAAALVAMATVYYASTHREYAGTWDEPDDGWGVFV
jgi:hypothetical protein